MIWSRYTERRIVMEEIPHMIHKMPRRRPADGTFELTVRCNLHCKMCLFRHDDSENQRIMEKELTAGQWIDMSEQAARAGTVSLLITGGEPMLRSDFSEIWKGIYQKGFLLTLYTNATLVTDEIMETDYIGDSYDEKNLYAVYQDKSGDSTLKPRVTLFGCDAGMRSYTISWDGQLLGCQMLGNFAEDAVGKGFQKAWDDFPKKVRLPAVNEKCQRCENHNICSSCCASRYAETKDLGGCPEYVCRDTAIVSELLRRKKNGNKNIGEI